MQAKCRVFPHCSHWTIYWVKQFGLRLEPMYPRAGKLFREKGGQLLEGQNRLSSPVMKSIISLRETFPGMPKFPGTVKPFDS